MILDQRAPKKWLSPSHLNAIFSTSDVNYTKERDNALIPSIDLKKMSGLESLIA